jgi:hypothetical protein
MENNLELLSFVLNMYSEDDIVNVETYRDNDEQTNFNNVCCN